MNTTYRKQLFNVQFLNQALVQNLVQTLSIGSIAALSVLPGSAQAATITRNFTGGDAPTEFSGSGNLVDIFNTAANYWESAIVDDLAIDISFGWSDLTEDGPLSEFFPIVQTANRSLEGEILFNTNTTAFNWFLDSTPQTNEEFGDALTFSEDFGAGELNIGRVFDGPNAEAQGNFDLLSIAIHELGHAFGVLNDYEAFELETLDDDDIDIAEGLPFSGSELFTTPLNGGHLDLPTAALDPFFVPGQRKLLSEADILAVATVGDISTVNLDPQPVGSQPGNPQPVETPEASTGLGFIALLGLGLGSRRWKRGDRA